MNLEQQNSDKRRNAPLTNAEAAGFFFIPIGFAKWNHWDNTDFNKTEMERFELYGFERKIRQAKHMRICGSLFYISIFIIILYYIV